MNTKRPRLRLLPRIGMLAALGLGTLSSGCATATGLVTGPFTGFIDLPSDVIERNQMRSDAIETWAIAIVGAPVGFVLGPFFGAIKGVALDVSAIGGSLSLHEEFGTYSRASIWRPYSFNWKTDPRYRR